jgi:alpha-beta hydrolase superfamily lysophospholipase
MAAAGAASPLLTRAAAAQPAPKARNVVLVHGLDEHSCSVGSLVLLD